MNPRPRALLIAVLALAATLTPAAAEAAGSPPLLEPRTMFDGALAAPAGNAGTACHRAYRPGGAGVATAA